MKVRKEDILAAALPLAEKYGYEKITRGAIADGAGISGPVINYHFGTMKHFRRELMRYAIDEGNLAVIAQGLSAGDPQSRSAPAALRRQALLSLL